MAGKSAYTATPSIFPRDGEAAAGLPGPGRGLAVRDLPAEERAGGGLGLLLQLRADGHLRGAGQLGLTRPREQTGSRDISRIFLNNCSPSFSERLNSRICICPFSGGFEIFL